MSVNRFMGMAALSIHAPITSSCRTPSCKNRCEHRLVCYFVLVSACRGGVLPPRITSTSCVHVRPKIALRLSLAIAYEPLVDLQLRYQPWQTLGPHQYLVYPRNLQIPSSIFCRTIKGVSRIALSSARNGSPPLDITSSRSCVFIHGT
jgi:hypothetical protein